MIEFITNDKDLTVKEIDEFIEKTDSNGVFATRHRWHSNFVKHFEQIMAVKQIVTFRKDGKLVGLCSWALVDSERKRQINKSRWLLPDDISEGDIFYLDVCLVRDGASIYKIKDYLVGKYKSLVKEVFWFNVPNSRVFRLNFKGGALCPKEQIAVC